MDQNWPGSLKNITIIRMKIHDQVKNVRGCTL